METPSEVLELLKSVDTIVICGHVNPDGDALGTNLALAALCRALGKKVTSLLAQNKPAPELYEFLPGYDFTPAELYSQTPDLFIAVDVPNVKRIAAGADVLARAKDSLVIDHHPNYEPFANHYFGDWAAPSAGSVVWRVIQASGVEITPEMASYCYVALMTDTGRFSFSNTNHQAFIDAAKMIEKGADPSYISLKVYENKSVASMKLEAKMIERIQFLGNSELVYSYIYEQDMSDLGVERDATESLPAILRSIKGVKVVALFREEEDEVRVNLRSHGGYNVGELAAQYGGGGHAAAAGISLKMPLQAAMDFLIPKLESLFD